MAVTLDVAGLVAALRLSDSPEELAEATRILAYAAEAVAQHAPSAPDTAHNEAAVRLSAFIYDQPTAARGDSYANAMRNSGAQRMLLPYRVHRAGYAEAVESAQAAVGSVSNPVTGLAVVAGQLVVTFADGTTESLDLPAGMGGGTPPPAPAGPATLYIAWRPDRNFTEADFTSSEAASGTVDSRLHPPAYPAAHASATGLIAGLWIGSEADVLNIAPNLGGIGAWQQGANLVIDGVTGQVWTSNSELVERLNAYPIPVTLDIPEPAGSSVEDDVARAAAAAAQATADTATTTATSAAQDATTAVANAAAAQTAAGTATSDAATAQAAAEAAQATTDGKVDATGAATAAMGVVSDWAEEGNTDAIPAAKLTNAPAGGGGGEWHSVGNLTGGAYVANTARTFSISYPVAGYADYDELRAAILDESIKQVAIAIQQNDIGDGDSDMGVTVIPNIAAFRGFNTADAWKVFPGFALNVNPIAFTVAFAVGGLTVQTDAALTASPAVSVAVGVWK